MSQERIPTEFLDPWKRKKTMVDSMNGNMKRILVEILIVLSFLGGVGVAVLARDQGELKHELQTQYVRKDALEPRMQALEENVKVMHEEQVKTNELLRRLVAAARN